MRGSRRPAILVGTVAAILLAGVGWLLAGGWAVERGVSWARRRMAEGHHAEARDRLARLSAWWPRDDRVSALLGECEARLDRPEAAIRAWRSISPDSPLAGSARLDEARVLIAAFGRLEEAERAFRAATREDRPGGPPAAIPARWELSRLLLWEGRLDEVRDLLREIARLGTSADRAAALREHWRLDSVVVTDQEVRPVLDRAERHTPDDPGVMLVHANLAAQYGRLDEAREWLDRCARRLGPDHSLVRAVALARLRLAMADGRPDEVERALDDIGEGALAPAESGWVRAWLAGRRGDVVAERFALEQVVAFESSHTRALDRLAELEQRAGQADQAARWRGRREEALRDRAAYRRLMIADRQDLPEVEMRRRAWLAGRLGRRFEEQGWLTLLLEREPGDRKAAAALDRLALADRRNPATLVRPPVEPASDLRPPGETPLPAPAAVAFRDEAEAAGLRFTYRNGASPEHPIPETIGGGAAVLDYDGDGRMDVLAVQGGSFPPRDAGDERPSVGDRLFRNRGDGSFEDVSESSGIARLPRGYGFGASVGDYDNDGRPDVFITRFGSYLLLHNRGDGTFEDATDRAGLGGPRDWPTSSAFADLDGDGDLDLYVCHYLEWNVQNPPVCRDPRAPDGRVSCLPLNFRALPDHLFRNDGGRFVDITRAAGIDDPDGRGLGVVAADLDGDGRIDLFVANDMSANLLFRNKGGMRFEEIGHTAGVACSADGGYQAGMGIACGDQDGDGRPDLAVTNFFGESTTLYRNLGESAFADATIASGLKAPSRFVLGFGAAFLDVDNDGRLDLATANGHVHDLRPSEPYPMPAQLFLGGPDGRLLDATATAGAPWTVARVGRGLAVLDANDDGRLD
ncbi:MAG: FG-GAP-like repeat-containing protein, partial [Isosphaeraceae bacterium]